MRPDPEPGPADPRFLRTDPRQRRNLGLLLAGVFAFAIVFYSFILPALLTWVTTGYTDTAVRKFGVACYVTVVLMLIVSVVVSAYARNIFRTGQFPLPGTWVLRDTRILAGEPARRIAWGMLAFAACNALLAIYIVLLPHLLHERLLPSEPAGTATLETVP